MIRGNPDEIQRTLTELKKEEEIIEKSIFRLAYHSNGSISLDQCWMLSPRERELAIKELKDIKLTESGQKNKEM